MRVTPKGRLTIPRNVLERAGLMPGDQVEMRVGDGVIQIQRTGVRKMDAIGKRLAAFAGSANRKYSTDELMTLLRGD